MERASVNARVFMCMTIIWDSCDVVDKLGLRFDFRIRVERSGG